MTRQGIRDALVVVLPAWVTARLLVGAGWLAAELLVDGDEPYALGRGLLAWDGDWYRSLMVHGYEGMPLESVRFFPGYVFLSRAIDGVLPGGQTTALLVVANLGTLVAMVLLHRLVLVESSSVGVARRAVWALALFPPAFVLVWAYAEGPFLAMVVGCLLLLRRERWWEAALLAAGAALVRPTGALLVVPALCAVARPSATARGMVGRGAVVVAGPLAAGGYVLWASVRFDEPFAPLTVQRRLRGDPVDPVRRLWEGLGELFGPDALGDGLHIVALAVLVVVLVVLARSWPLRYGAFAGACLVVALAADNLNSLERYSLNGVPIVLGVATMAGHRRLGGLVPLASGLALVALSAAAWSGSYVP
ncbi:MAG: hypothetical protein VX897_06390 [Actinomycetota bacterium]|nr:hypothetical protein [Actinomycetota bacterium]MEC9424841.1 hypothetical protein [Actinomycetota bacterium]